MNCGWLGVSCQDIDEIRGGDAAENAQTLTGILSGEVKGAKRDLALVNAAGAFVAAGLASEMGPGIKLAKEQIDSGSALAKLRAFQELSARRAA
jgi:anthranilate phosphoribosyltransferase